MTKEIIQEYLNLTYPHRWPNGVEVLSIKEISTATIHNPNVDKNIDRTIYLYSYSAEGNDTGVTSIDKEVLDEFIQNQRESKIDKIIN